MENMEYNKLQDSHKNLADHPEQLRLNHVKASARVNVGMTSSPQPGTSSSTTEIRTSNGAYCEGEHYIATCAKFRALTPVARRRAVVDKYLCFNCLGKHSVCVSQTTKRCQTCNEKHHTLIHVVNQRRTGSSQISGGSGNQQAAASTGPPPPTTCLA